MNLSNKYAEVEVNSMSQNELEVRALLRTASTLNYIKESWDERKGGLSDALDKNRRLWTIFASEMGNSESALSVEIKKNILNLANFVFKRTVEILIDPKPDNLKVLIDININVAKGLSELKTEENGDGGVESANVAPSPEVKKEDAMANVAEDEYEDIFGG